jgi:hypothetical protein
VVRDFSHAKGNPERSVFLEVSCTCQDGTRKRKIKFKSVGEGWLKLGVIRNRVGLMPGGEGEGIRKRSRGRGWKVAGLGGGGMRRWEGRANIDCCLFTPGRTGPA